MADHAYHELFTATAGIFAALWVIFSAIAIFMAQQRASTGAKLTYVTGLTPARAMLGNAYFFAGMEISLIELLPTADPSAKLWGEIFSLILAYAPLGMLLVLAIIARSERVWQSFWNNAPFYIVASIPIWGLFYLPSDRASTAVFSLLGFGCLWTLISIMYLIFYANEWSSSAALASSPEELAATNNALADLLKRGEATKDALSEFLRASEERAEIQERQIALLKKIDARVNEIFGKKERRDQDENN